jgi:nickel-dependent lactate racemase
VRLTLRYHDGAFDVDLAARSGIRVVGNSFPKRLENWERALGDALDKPIGASPLMKLIPRTGTISVLISDITRGASTGKILSRLLRFLDERGAAPERVRIVLALGAHRPHGAGELEAHLGSETVGRWRVIEHHAGDCRSLLDVGTTKAGTRCLFKREVAESALVIALGSVSFHYFAGYGGARKLILPGVAGEETIFANHRLSLKGDPGEGLSDGCRPGNLDGNPVHEDMLEGARLLGTRLFAVNSVPDGDGNIVFVNAGEIDASHRSACDFVSEHFRFPVERPYRAVIISAGGFPKDINLLQSHKALRSASYALDEGGIMLAAAACAEGTGSDSYLAAFDGGRQAVPDAVRKCYRLNSQTAMSTFELTGRLSIYLKSMLPEALVERFGMCPWKDGYIEYLLDGIADADILAIPNASMFLPM